MTDQSSLMDNREEEGQRRTYQMMVEEINSKLSSKTDWYQYLEEHL